MPVKVRKFLVIFLMGILALFPFAGADSMQSASYRIDNDSINFGGMDDSGSANYRISDTMGEIGTGEMSEKCSSMNFDGTDEYVKVPSAASMNISGDYSISMWVYNRAGAKIYPTLLNKEPQSSSNGFFWIYTAGTNETDIKFQYANGSYIQITFYGALGLNKWTHLVFTFVDATKSLTLFVDGQQFSTTRILSGALPVDGGDLYLGTYQTNYTNYAFNGYLDDVRIYTRTLSSVEVSDLYGGRQIDNSGLGGRWDFDEGSGTTTADFSGNGNTGTIYGSAAFSDDYPSQTCNVLNSAGYRDMNQTYISISSPADAAMSPTIGGVNGGTGDGSAVWNVKTDNPAGYQIGMRAGASPALQSGSYSFADYTPAVSGVPDYDWSIENAASEFGYTVEGNNTVAKFLDNGSVCNSGSGNTSGRCWLNFSTNDQTIVSSVSPNHPLGTDTTIRFRAQSGNSHLQPEGNYSATIIVTAVEL